MTEEQLGLTLAAFAVALSVEKTWLDVKEELGGDFPDGACNEASIALRDELAEKLPAAGAEYVWGEFQIGGEGFGHAWVALDGGAILDLTAGQFLRDGPALALVLPSYTLARHYHEIDRKPPDPVTT
jgi:hypothetical protein